MNIALKQSANIFLSRLSSVIGVYFFFILTGHIRSDALGELNVYLSFINVFDAIAIITFVYFQNESSRSQNPDLLLAKGFQVAILLGTLVAIVASVAAWMSFFNSILFWPILLTTMTYPILSLIALMSYYFEGMNQSNITLKVHLLVSLFQTALFFVLLKLDYPVVWSAAIAFLVKESFTLLGLLTISNKTIVLTKNLLTKKDIKALIHKGLPNSLSETIARYINSLIVLTISFFGISASNLYATSTRTVTLLLLPSIAIAQSFSIYYGSTDPQQKEVRDCIKLQVIYAIGILSLVVLALPQVVQIIFNYAIPLTQISDTKLVTIAWFCSCLMSAISIPAARAIGLIKIPQTLYCIGLFSGLVIGKWVASNMFDFIYITATTNGMVALIIFGLVLSQKNPKEL